MLPEGESFFGLSWYGKRNMSSRWLRFSGGYMRYAWEYVWMTNHPRQYFSELAAGNLLGWPSFNVGVCPSSLQRFFYAITCPTDISALEGGCWNTWLCPVMFFSLKNFDGAWKLLLLPLPLLLYSACGRQSAPGKLTARRAGDVSGFALRKKQGLLA